MLRIILLRSFLIVKINIVNRYPRNMDTYEMSYPKVELEELRDEPAPHSDPAVDLLVNELEE